MNIFESVRSLFFPFFTKDLNTKVNTNGAKIHSYRCDLLKDQDIEHAFKWIKEHFGSIAILICNAGIIKANLLSGE